MTETQVQHVSATFLIFRLTHVDWGPGLSVLSWCVPLRRVAAEVIRPLRDGKGRAGRRAPHDSAGSSRREHAQRPRWADGVRTGPLLLVFRRLRRLGSRRGWGRWLKMKVRHLWQRERHLSGVAQGALPQAAVSSHPTLQGRRWASVLQSAVRGVLGLLLRVALNVGPGLGQCRDRVQREARRALVSRRVGHLGVTAAALEAGPQVLRGRPVGVRRRPVDDVQQGRASMHVGGEALQDRRASLLDRGVMRRRRDRRMTLWDGRVALGDRGVALVVDGRVKLHWRDRDEKTRKARDKNSVGRFVWKCFLQ